ncbi:hypothetical protein A7U60_g1342 [Sanghuangporus baumii]|uniref:beta-glucosidase n=1 Tax=Sanghuangporus baumii TaxID=108892 RepID=A0A9Q5I440_SANBA|nr:hypothetical protein A7U60_g1342 [Sanghuangporus baumii]
MSRSFLEADVHHLINRLTLDEKIGLLSAPDWWNSSSVKRLGIPSVRMSDGPNGVRGSSHFISTPAQCLPCGTALGSTFDTELVYKVGEFLSAEAKIKSSVVLLAPTCNIQINERSPLGGRSFESFSEDPTLSGLLSAAYINGVQSQGVAATIKHFVANDQEHERTAVNSVISERALREIYLYPFMLAQKLARPWAFMTSYGRIDGIHCSENKRYGTYSVDLALQAGLDLEMPGPSRWRTPLLMTHMLSSQKVSMKDINDRVLSVLSFVQKLARKNSDVVYGDGSEKTCDSPETRRFCRNIASETIVLLKNEGGLLPLRPEEVRTIAVIGPHAKGSIISGGGSAALKPAYVVTPWDGLVSNSDFEFKFAQGCYGDGEPGWLCTFYNCDETGIFMEPVAKYVLNDTRVKVNDFLPDGLGEEWGLMLEGLLSVEKDVSFEFGLAVSGRAKLFINDELTIDNWTHQRSGDFFYGREKVTVPLLAGGPITVKVVYISSPAESRNQERDLSQPALMRGLRLGGAEKIDESLAIKEASDLAANCDAAIVVCGLTPEWESEGFDRSDLDLPRSQNELIKLVGRANRRTVVVVQAGSAVNMESWVNDIDGIVLAWYLGNEAGNAIADILWGKVNPCGKLPFTIPKRIEDVPSYLSFGSENGEVVYREDLFVGYKYYQARRISPLFAFGHGLSYSSFSLSDLKITVSCPSNENFAAEVTVKVVNTASVLGSEVIQAYVDLPSNGTTTPKLQLRGFTKVRDLEPGSSEVGVITLDKYAVSFWDSPRNAWRAIAAKYHVRVGTSSDNLPLEGSFDIETEFSWIGL